MHPGTLVVKFGAATGITCGQLIGIRSLTYTEKGVEFAVTDAVVVQLEPLGSMVEVHCSSMWRLGKIVEVNQNRAFVVEYDDRQRAFEVAQDCFKMFPSVRLWSMWSRNLKTTKTRLK